MGMGTRNRKGSWLHKGPTRFRAERIVGGTYKEKGSSAVIPDF